MLGRARIHARRDRDSDMTNPAGTTGQMFATPDARVLNDDWSDLSRIKGMVVCIESYVVPSASAMG
jgi:hypothetical protein